MYKLLSGGNMKIEEIGVSSNGSPLFRCEWEGGVLAGKVEELDLHELAGLGVYFVEDV
jgi:hypothetical protein